MTTPAPRPAFGSGPGRPRGGHLEVVRAGGPRLVLAGGTKLAATIAAVRAEAEPDRTVHLVVAGPTDPIRGAASEPANLRTNDLSGVAARERFGADHRGTVRAIADRAILVPGENLAVLLDLSAAGMDELAAVLGLARLVEAPGSPVVVVDASTLGDRRELLDRLRRLGRWLDALDALLGKHRTGDLLSPGPCAEDELQGFVDRQRVLVAGLDVLLCDREDCRCLPVASRDPDDRSDGRRCGFPGPFGALRTRFLDEVDAGVARLVRDLGPDLELDADGTVLRCLIDLAPVGIDSFARVVAGGDDAGEAIDPDRWAAMPDTVERWTRRMLDLLAAHDGVLDAHATCRDLARLREGARRLRSEEAARGIADGGRVPHPFGGDGETMRRAA